MPREAQRYDFDRVFRLLLTVGTLIGVLWLLAYLSDVLVPFAVAVLIAYLLNPIVNAFELKTGRRGLAVALTLAIFIVFISVAVPLVGALIYTEIADASQIIADQEVKAAIIEKIDPWVEKLSSQDFQSKLREFIENNDPDQIKQLAIDGLKVLLPKLWDMTTVTVGFLGSVLNAVLALGGVVIVLLYLVFLMMDFNSFQARWKDHLPPLYRDTIVGFLEEFSAAMGRYFRGQFLVAATCGVLLAIGFSLLGLRMAVMFGLFVGLLNMVPYLQTLGLVPALLLAALKAFESDTTLIWPILWVLMVFAVVQLIQDGLLVPKIMGKSTGLKPWVILLSIFVWGKLLGFLGLVLAIPLSCLGLAYYRRFILRIDEAP